MGHNQHKQYTQCELYMQCKGHNECTAQMQHTVTHRQGKTCITCIIHRIISCAAVTTHAIEPSAQWLKWLGWTIAPVSRLKTLPPSATGTPGVGFWRGGCPESMPHIDHEKKAMWGCRPKRFGVSVAYIQHCKDFRQIATLQQRLTMQSVNDVLQQNCVSPT